jgi:hypothetical protein
VIVGVKVLQKMRPKLPHSSKEVRRKFRQTLFTIQPNSSNERERSEISDRSEILWWDATLKTGCSKRSHHFSLSFAYRADLSKKDILPGSFEQPARRH